MIHIVQWSSSALDREHAHLKKKTCIGLCLRDKYVVSFFSEILL